MKWIVRATSVLGIVAGVVGCSGDDEDKAQAPIVFEERHYDSSSSFFGAGNTVGASVPTGAPVLPTIYREPIRSVEELIAKSDLVAVVSVERKLGEHWPKGQSPEIFVVSRFSLRVEEVLKGDVEPGQLIVGQVPGGTVRTGPMPAHGGSLKPESGEPAEVVQDPGWPFYRAGTYELVFLEQIVSDDGETVFIDVGPPARYRIDGDRLIAVAAESMGIPQAEIPPESVMGQFAGSTLAEASHLVQTAR